MTSMAVEERQIDRWKNRWTDWFSMLELCALLKSYDIILYHIQSYPM